MNPYAWIDNMYFSLDLYSHMCYVLCVMSSLISQGCGVDMSFKSGLWPMRLVSLLKDSPIPHLSRCPQPSLKYDIYIYK